MTDPAPRPLLFLDVDGPLIPFGATRDQLPHGYPTYPTPSSREASLEHPLLDRMNPGYGPRLAALPCDLVWATTWAEDANECISPRLGLPRLPVVDWPDSPDSPGSDDIEDALHWKTRALVAWAAGRPFAWLDDEITDADRAWVSAHHPGRALLLRVGPTVGLTDADFIALDRWLRDRP
ncbi:hypothetical protein ABIA32_004269 [Streptacidiphilus sp. MAP12-20]|uniref:HAD domain-containing protein n=1 Tax=Streptacidiphilus sp. MAP12-20 TaxID=3156299 RepID=UPI0035175495